MKTYYDLLGLPNKADATAVSRRKKDLYMLWHPDRWSAYKGLSIADVVSKKTLELQDEANETKRKDLESVIQFLSQQIKESHEEKRNDLISHIITEKFKELEKAVGELSDPQKKTFYDNSLADEEAKQEASKWESEPGDVTWHKEHPDQTLMPTFVILNQQEISSMTIKILLLGHSTSGKDNFLVQLKKPGEDQTLSKLGVDSVRFSLQNKNFQIWDTAGQERHTLASIILFGSRGAQAYLFFGQPNEYLKTNMSEVTQKGCTLCLIDYSNKEPRLLKIKPDMTYLPRQVQRCILKNEQVAEATHSLVTSLTTPVNELREAPALEARKNVGLLQAPKELTAEVPQKTGFLDRLFGSKK